MKFILFFILFLSSLSLWAQEDPLYPIKERFLDENIKPHVVFGDSRPFISYILPHYVTYYNTPELRSRYEMQIIDGRIYRNGKLFTNLKGLKISHSIFVLSQDNKVYFSEKIKKNRYHHSTLVAGEPVKFAGEMVIVDGEILAVNNMSGHYWPDGESYYVFKRVLREMGYLKELPELSERFEITMDYNVVDGVLKKLNGCDDKYL